MACDVARSAPCAERLDAATVHRSASHRAVSTTRRPQESRAHHRVGTGCARGTRAGDGPARRAGRHGRTAAVRGRRGARRRGVGAALRAVRFSGGRRRRQGPRGPATPATHAAETVDALLAGVDSYRRRLHRHPGERPRGTSQESRRGARLDVHPSRLSLHRRMRVAGAVVRGESLARGGRRAAPGDPRWQGRLAGAVRQRAHGLARSRNIRAAGVAGGKARPRARSDVLLGPNHRRPGPDPHVSHAARRERREVSRERTQPRARGAAAAAEWRERRHRVSAALLLGRSRRQPRPALAGAPLRRRHALWL